MKGQKEIRKEKREECTKFFKEKERKAKKIFFECFTGLVLSSFIFLFLENIFTNQKLYEVAFYVSGFFVALFSFLTIKWIRGIIFQKRMQVVSRILFDSMERELEKFD